MRKYIHACMHATYPNPNPSPDHDHDPDPDPNRDPMTLFLNPAPTLTATLTLSLVLLLPSALSLTVESGAAPGVTRRDAPRAYTAAWVPAQVSM